MYFSTVVPKGLRLIGLGLGLSLAFASRGEALGKPLPPTADEARRFVKVADREMRRLLVRQQTAEWIKSTFITDDTERNAASAGADVLAYLAGAQKEAARLSSAPKIDPETRRLLLLLRTATNLPAPDDAAARDTLTSLSAKLEGMYGKAQACDAAGQHCRDLGALESVMDHSRNADELASAWKDWHDTARPMRPLYTQLVNLGNQGAQELQFKDLSELWLSSYDAPPSQVRAQVDQLYNAVAPLYKSLHCYTRMRLTQHYGASIVPPKGPIPAHLLGNMWAQEWSDIYPLLEPYPGEASLDVTGALKQQKYSAERMAKTAESFFVSLGLDPLPKTFWERSLFTKPRDRDVVCHASAWDVTLADDLRIKMCIQVQEKDLVTLHHELGHLYYFHAYQKLPVLLQQGANDGFHEAIGDAIALSVTPAYLKSLGLVSVASKTQHALINAQLKEALERVAFLPFGRVVDQWRWDVFSGKISPDHYNQSWWDLRRQFQGVVPPVERTEVDFDPGAKYHVAAGVPYLRYFLARILQFQFHRGLCQAAGFRGPLHECSIFGSKAAGKKLQAMMALGAEKPWPDALELLTGERRMDAGAMLEYFTPLRKWLAEQTRGQSCGW